MHRLSCAFMLFPLGLAACATKSTPPRAPTIAQPVASDSGPRRAPTTTEDEEHEREWHAYRPEPMPGTGVSGSLPLYLVATTVRSTPALGHLKDGTSAVGLGTDVAIVKGDRLDFDLWRGRARETGEPAHEIGDISGDSASSFWVRTRSPIDPDNLYPDPFLDYRGSTYRYSGQWKYFPTFELPVAYGSGHLVFDLPRFEKPVDANDPACADSACAGLVPLFWGSQTTGPDLKSLVGKIAWTHFKGESDYDYVVDPSGPVYVLLRALDLGTKRRTFGVVSWTATEGARFAPIGAPLDATKSVFVRGTLAKSRPIFKVEVRGSATATYEVTHDGRAWTAKREAPPPKPKPGTSAPAPEGGGWDESAYLGPEVEGYRVNRRATAIERRTGPGADDWEIIPDGQMLELSSPPGKKGDLWAVGEGRLYHSVAPIETMAVTEERGKAHPWPLPATDSCTHPFVVIDALETSVYDAMLEERASNPKAVGRWGQIPKELAYPLVETRLFGHVIIGASFPTMTEAKAFTSKWSRLDGWGGTFLTEGGPRYASGIVCARPVAPRPFPQ